MDPFYQRFSPINGTIPHSIPFGKPAFPKEPKKWTGVPVKAEKPPHGGQKIHTSVELRRNTQSVGWFFVDITVSARRGRFCLDKKWDPWYDIATIQSDRGAVLMSTVRQGQAAVGGKGSAAERETTVPALAPSGRQGRPAGLSQDSVECYQTGEAVASLKPAGAFQKKSIRAFFFPKGGLSRI